MLFKTLITVCVFTVAVAPGYIMASDLFAVDSTGSFYTRYAPIDANDNWFASANQIGTSGWNDYKFLFFAPDGDLYAVKSDGSFFKGAPPTYAHDDWISRATKISNGGWTSFKFLFFDLDGDLHAVKSEGNAFLKGSPPTDLNDNWSARAKQIGTHGWTAFNFLFFGPDSDLYAVRPDGSFLKGYPPTYASEAWSHRATPIGTQDTGRWGELKFLFFGPGDYLYAVPPGGALLKATAPTYAEDHWNARSTKIGNGGWANFVFLFSDSIWF